MLIICKVCQFIYIYINETYVYKWNNQLSCPFGTKCIPITDFKEIEEISKYSMYSIQWS